MKILTCNMTGEEELIDKLRKVTMLKNPDFKPYEKAFISIERVDPRCLVPVQNYLLESNLKSKMELYYAFKEKRFMDIFNATGAIQFYLEDDEARTEYTLLPPIVEESIENNGQILPVIGDGMHRVYLGLCQHRGTITVVYIRGVQRYAPYYAYPVYGGWDKVEIVHDTPAIIKKYHRIQDNKLMYRNFESVFPNCSAPRGDIKVKINVDKTAAVGPTELVGYDLLKSKVMAINKW